MAQGTVISVNLKATVKKRDGGTYEGWELIYKTDEGEVRTVQKPIQGLRFNKGLQASLSSLKPGDRFVMEQEKNAAGFLDVKSLTKMEGDFVAENVAAKPVARSGGTYETPEERKQRQDYIIRQSSLSSAVAVLTAGAKAPPKKEDVVELAEYFVNYVYNKVTAENFVDTLADDIPY